ncbi:hypothetical protein GCM10010502_00650 [Kitasatospora aureofaciens]|uniref:Uncharacterized protein n=1 Tax=Kitasatospora aureofaciens TaxID=1894 RepID=A0A8H9HF95_KITAU|nr:hypothetical protein GCM10010502_00650 [Kitasatospora aureofaciens]
MAAGGGAGWASRPSTETVPSPSGVFGGVQTFPFCVGKVTAIADGTLTPVIVKATNAATAGDRHRPPAGLPARLRAGQAIVTSPRVTIDGKSNEHGYAMVDVTISEGSDTSPECSIAAREMFIKS